MVRDVGFDTTKAPRPPGNQSARLAFGLLVVTLNVSGSLWIIPTRT